jgi:hypothetical protein
MKPSVGRVFLVSLLVKLYLYQMLSKIKYLGVSITSFAILFKLMSWQFADKLLIAGLSSLGIYYFIQVFRK